MVDSSRRGLEAVPSPKERDKLAHQKKKRRRRKKRLAIPAGLVFYTTATLALISSAIVYLEGHNFLAYSASVCILITIVLFVNERGGFTRSKRMRRTGETRVSFNDTEILILFILLMIGIFVSVVAFLDRSMVDV
jgi:amino acid permease